ncbi:MAG: hypothetical protein M1396_02460, partial [Chloroflexi bacterium]|nr:hypothetical protein [Chloroflexota bacterium]
KWGALHHLSVSPVLHATLGILAAPLTSIDPARVASLVYERMVRTAYTQSREIIDVTSRHPGR